MSKDLNVFWYETDSIHQGEILAPLALAFDNIIIPQNIDRSRIYYNHNLLTRPIAQENVNIFMVGTFAEKGQPRPLKFSSVEEYNNRYKYQDVDVLRDANAESNMLDFARMLISRAKVNNFISYSKSNNGICLGKTDLHKIEFFYEESCQNDINNLVDTLLITLAIAGIEVALPNITTNNEEILLEIREKNKDEREEYQLYIRELIYDGSGFIKTDPCISEISRWAKFVAKTKILSSLQQLERAIKSRSNRSLLKNIGIGILDKVPSFIASQSEKANTSNILTAAGLQMISILSPNLFKSIIERSELEKNFGISYLYKLKKTINKRIG